MGFGLTLLVLLSLFVFAVTVIDYLGTVMSMETISDENGLMMENKRNFPLIIWNLTGYAGTVCSHWYLKDESGNLLELSTLVDNGNIGQFDGTTVIGVGRGFYGTCDSDGASHQSGYNGPGASMPVLGTNVDFVGAWGGGIGNQTNYVRMLGTVTTEEFTEPDTTPPKLASSDSAGCLSCTPYQSILSQPWITGGDTTPTVNASADESLSGAAIIANDTAPGNYNMSDMIEKYGGTACTGSGAGPWSCTPSEANALSGVGSGYICVAFNDTSGNQDLNASFCAEVIADVTAPGINITFPVNTTTYATSTLDLNWTINETPNWCAYSLDNTANNTEICGSTTTLNLTDLTDIDISGLTDFPNACVLWITVTGEFKGTFDNTNGYLDQDETLDRAVRFFIADCDGEFTTSDGDSIILTYDAGQTKTVYFPADTWYIARSLRIADDGSTFDNWNIGENECYNLSYGAGGAGASGAEWKNITLTSLSDGLHNITIYANDTSGNMGHSDFTFWTVDTTPPVISGITDVSGGGTGITDDTTPTISLTTDEDATCYISTDNSTWVEMGTTGTKSHEGNVPDAQALTLGRNKNVYIKCDDAIPNTAYGVIVYEILGGPCHYNHDSGDWNVDAALGCILNATDLELNNLLINTSDTGTHPETTINAEIINMSNFTIRGVEGQPKINVVKQIGKFT